MNIETPTAKWADNAIAVSCELNKRGGSPCANLTKKYCEICDMAVCYSHKIGHEHSFTHEVLASR